MSKSNTNYDAPWTSHLAHRSDPNRVGQRQTPTPGHFEHREPSAISIPADPSTLTQRPPPAPHRPSGSEPSYYDVSMLKRPVWKWQIASYFFLGGLSAGAYLLARTAERAAGERHRSVVRAGTWVALATLAASPPLLIADLGDPKRFHHMLRVFKPTTPMNLGTWLLTAYGGMVAAAATRELLRERRAKPSTRPVQKIAKAWLAAHDVAGVPLALGVAGYTGVLLSCTANPLWCKNPWLGPLFSASAISTGAEAISLAIDSTSKATAANEASQAMLQKVDTAAHVAEAVCMRAFTRRAGEKAKPLIDHSSETAKWHTFAKRALLASEVLKRLPAGPRLRKPLRMLASLSGLAGGFAMRWAMVYGGKAAADDAHLARVNSRG
jgi:formate-dependent nitrite reductase membrane component NrfD